MKITRFYATESGESRFVEIDIPIALAQRDADGHTLHFSNSYPSPSVRFAELPDGMVQSWHHAPARQIVVVLSGFVARRFWQTVCSLVDLPYTASR